MLFAFYIFFYTLKHNYFEISSDSIEYSNAWDRGLQVLNIDDIVKIVSTNDKHRFFLSETISIQSNGNKSIHVSTLRFTRIQLQNIMKNLVGKCDKKYTVIDDNLNLLPD